ncbi:porphobilinogen deaminase-like isoform X2 [Tubulanus polymorphus]
MTTVGDKILDVALSKIGEKSLFTKELERALQDDKVDIVVHSLKDLPTELPPGMTVAAVLKRDSPYDAVVLHTKHKGKKLSDLPDNSVVGTSSLRRIAQLKKAYPKLDFQDIRGNLNTRLKKLDEGNIYDAIVLAEAGLVRMGWSHRISHVLETDICMYAVSQGALAVECRSEDTRIIDLLSVLHDEDTLLRCIAERSLLSTLEGGCSVPIAVHTTVDKEIHQLVMKCGIFSLDGSECAVRETYVQIEDEEEEPSPKKLCPTREFASVVAKNIRQKSLRAADELGKKCAELLREIGGQAILTKAKNQTAETVVGMPIKNEQS